MHPFQFNWLEASKAGRQARKKEIIKRASRRERSAWLDRFCSNFVPLRLDHWSASVLAICLSASSLC
ncbi:hypothetical protein T4A_4886 [Trichinella pseudospiralis]|uniref:Uncharacterized protein n=1 Tax=Trichinella pseudospiralis TaxID=6337 RepID=A0A0V1K960_TRIPS|nr:hypothetical protein T4A_4886 [Trichinella pseudospiralis]KRZ43723.1 hypothetical protein T4C_13211 [Trichinella pseudospiralis]